MTISSTSEETSQALATVAAMLKSKLSQDVPVLSLYESLNIRALARLLTERTHQPCADRPAEGERAGRIAAVAQRRMLRRGGEARHDAEC